MLLLASAGKKRRENFLSLHRHTTQVKGKLGLPYNFFSRQSCIFERFLFCFCRVPTCA